MRLSALEHLLVASAHEQFGEPLTQFLLAGLGDGEPAQGRLFTIEFTEHSTKLRREVKVSTSEHSYDSTPLPQRREPLVILALLRLLIVQDQTSSANLSYKLEEILEILGWKDTAQSRRTIDEAVEHYSNLTYWWTMSADELALKKLTCYESRECFVTGYSRIDGVVGEDEQVIRVNNRIDFSMDFIERLKRKSLFEIDWNNVCSMSHIVQF